MLVLLAVGGLADVPVPVTCDDPIAGRWVGIERRPRGWLHYTVDIRPATPTGTVTGTIRGHFWASPDRAPPPCAGRSHEEYMVHQTSLGTFAAGALDFRALQVDRIDSICGGPSHRYLPDRITGSLRRPSVLDAISDDGGAPPSHVVFTRVACRRPGV